MGGGALANPDDMISYDRCCSGKVSDSRSADHGFDSRPRHCRATALSHQCASVYQAV